MHIFKTFVCSSVCHILSTCLNRKVLESSYLVERLFLNTSNYIVKQGRNVKGQGQCEPKNVKIIIGTLATSALWTHLHQYAYPVLK